MPHEAPQGTGLANPEPLPGCRGQWWAPMDSWNPVHKGKADVRAQGVTVAPPWHSNNLRQPYHCELDFMNPFYLKPTIHQTTWCRRLMLIIYDQGHHSSSLSLFTARTDCQGPSRWQWQKESTQDDRTVAVAFFVAQTAGLLAVAWSTLGHALS